MKSRWAPVAALIAVVIAVSGARVVRLGQSGFWFDEFLHAFAARSLAHDGVPRVPSGEVYTRGLEITRLVAIAQQHISDPELAARLPSAILGIANVLIFAAIGWRLGGPWTAMWAALLMGIYPGAFVEARNTRFYTEQLNLGLVAFWFGWLSIRDGPLAASAALLRTWAYIMGAAVAFAAAAVVQITTGSVAFAYALVLAIAATGDIRVLGRAALRASARVQAVLLGTALMVIVAALRPTIVILALRTALYVPEWARGQFSPKTYYWILSTSLPLIFALLPVIFVAVAKRSFRLAGYLSLWFGIPLILHSVVFRFQAERYVLLAMPGLLMATAVAATMACGAGYGAVRDALAQRGLDIRSATRIAALCVFVGAGTAVATTPAFTLTRRLGDGPLGRRKTDWRLAGEVMRRVPGSDSIPWGTASPLGSLFYSGRADFAIFSIFALDQDAMASKRQREVNAGNVDFYTGIPIMRSPADIRARYRAKGAVLIATDSARVAEQRGSPLDAVLRREAVELCELRCGVMRVFYWRFADSTRGAGLDPPTATDRVSDQHVALPSAGRAP